MTKNPNVPPCRGHLCSYSLPYINTDSLAADASRVWFKQRTAECRMSNRRMSKEGFALLSSFYKKDRIHSFDIRHSLFDIRYSFFYKLRKTGSLFRLDWPLFRPATTLIRLSQSRPDLFNRWAGSPSATQVGFFHLIVFT
jgi:hypothetical protein